MEIRTQNQIKSLKINVKNFLFHIELQIDLNQLFHHLD